MNMPWHSVFSFLIFLFGNNIIRDNIDEKQHNFMKMNSVAVMLFFWKISF